MSETSGLGTYNLGVPLLDVTRDCTDSIGLIVECLGPLLGAWQAFTQTPDPESRSTIELNNLLSIPIGGSTVWILSGVCTCRKPADLLRLFLAGGGLT